MLHRLEYRFFIPVAPSLNSAYRNVKGKGRVKTQKCQEWSELAGYALNAQLGGIPTALEKDIRIHADIQRPNMNSDISNRVKLMEDLLVKHGIITDDRFVNELHIRWIAKNGAFEDPVPEDLVEMNLGCLAFVIVRGVSNISSNRFVA